MTPNIARGPSGALSLPRFRRDMPLRRLPRIPPPAPSRRPGGKRRLTCITANGAVLSCHGYSSSTRDSRYFSARFFVSVTFSAVAIARRIHSPPAWGSAFMAVELETS